MNIKVFKMIFNRAYRLKADKPEAAIHVFKYLIE